MGSIEFSNKYSPIHLITFEGVPTDEEFRDYLRGIDRIIAEKRPYAHVLDASRAGPTPASHRQMQTEWMKQNKLLIKAHCRGTAFVFASASLRFVLSAIFLVQPMPCPYLVTGSTPEAVSWCASQLRAAGVHVPTTWSAA